MLHVLRQRISVWTRKVDLLAVRGLRRQQRTNLILFLWYGILLAISSAFVDSYVTIYALAYGATSEQIGWLSSLSSFFGMIMPIPGSQWAASQGRYKPVVIIAFALRRVMLFLVLLIPLFLDGQAAVIAIIVFFALRAAFMHLGNTPWTAFAGLIIPPDRRGRYFSARKSVMALVAIFAVPLAGRMIESLGEPLGYQISFSIAIVFGLAALVAFERIPEPQPATKQQSTMNLSAFVKALTGNRTFLYFTLISMFFNFSWMFGGPYFGVYNVEVLGATPYIIGTLSITSSIARMVGQQVWGRLVDRKGARWTFVLVMMFIPILPFIWFPLTNPWQVVFVYVPSGLLWAGREIANINLLWTLPDEETQSHAIASYNTLLSLANILGPLAGAQVLNWLGYKWVFGISGVGRFIALLGFIWLLKPFTKQTRAESAV